MAFFVHTTPYWMAICKARYPSATRPSPKTNLKEEYRGRHSGLVLVVVSVWLLFAGVGDNVLMGVLKHLFVTAMRTKFGTYTTSTAPQYYMLTDIEGVLLNVVTPVRPRAVSIYLKIWTDARKKVVQYFINLLHAHSPV